MRFLSAEPLLGPVNLDGLRSSDGITRTAFYEWSEDGPDLHWVIVGGESGPEARPMDAAWARHIVSDCTAAGVPVFVKQMGAGERSYTPKRRLIRDSGHGVFLVTGPTGDDPFAWPVDLRRQSTPATGQEPD